MYRVYVLNRHGHPLMPCTPATARHLLKDGKAKVKKRTPFTIQFLHGSSGYTQEIILGVDAGSKTIGLSASTKAEELFAAEVYPRNDVVDKLSTRREFRRARRSRQKRHRKPRFQNRVHSEHKGWLAPSVEVKIQEHIAAISRVCGILPVSKVVVETAEFDLQLIKAMQDGLPAPKGTDYQHGEMLGHYNVRQYVLYRDRYTCQCCGAHGKGVKLYAYHKESRKTGGEAPDNLVTLCGGCFKKLEEGILTMSGWRKRGRPSTRDAVFMGIMRDTLMSRLESRLAIPVAQTKGYVTKYTRNELLKLPKTHINDALAIAQGVEGFNTSMLPELERAERQYWLKPVRHHNRQLHKATILKGGIRKNDQAPKYVKGFRLFDKVRYQGQECFIWGRRESGSFLLRLLDGTLVKDGVSYKKLTLLERSTNYLIA